MEKFVSGETEETKPVDYSEHVIEYFDTIDKIVTQLESCNYECEAGPLSNNVAFIALKKLIQTKPVEDKTIEDIHQRNMKKLFEIETPKPVEDKETQLEPIQNALYATGKFTTDECTELAEGILIYINESQTPKPVSEEGCINNFGETKKFP